ncbi:RNA polymerase sigma factor [Allorhodopirellula heiligendammensis]|uniref:RNA polymerase sigma factor n=1 Tax=Allorhodopirellula heiligendammensis TaxID=2714739 RepID=A0A5C6BIC1_9BACT|nr:sigma-70 family RNA polymerase sigma factor [Allorhodopirellula heiligendammensis]TWU11066.1 RNA polymerase sigma factor [Allorhodopirellula heiligendammensis]
MSDTRFPTPPEHPTLSTFCLDGVQQLDPRQWSRLVETFGPIVYRWCRVAGVPESEAADLVQNVFVSVARKIPAFERQKDAGSFRSWLATITRNQVRDFFRQASRRADAQGGTAAQRWMLDQVDHLGDSIDGGSISAPLLKSILETVRAEFEDVTWQAFWLTTIENQQPSLVAERTGLSLVSVYQAKSRVLKRLRAAASQWLE